MTLNPSKELLNQDLIDFYEQEDQPLFKIMKIDLNGIAEDGTKIKKNKSKKDLCISKRFNFFSDNMTKIEVEGIKRGYEIHKSTGLYSAALIYTMQIPEILCLPYHICNELTNIFQSTDDGYDKEILDYLYDVCMIIPRIFDTTALAIGGTIIQTITGMGVGVAMILNTVKKIIC